MKISIIGGGPAGLYAGILLKKARPQAAVEVIERNRADDTFGWGVVFSDETLGHFQNADEDSYRRITAEFVHWTNIDIHFGGEVVRTGGHGFSGIARRRLLAILQERAAALGVRTVFSHDVTDLAPYSSSDLVIAADGINSTVRASLAEHFQPSVVPGRAKFIWLGTTRRFDAFKFFIRKNEHGVFQVHAYPFDAEQSTFIVETDEATWQSAGLDRMSIDEGVRYCETLFAQELDGHRLLTNKSDWINFRLVTNQTWHHHNVVLIGDAAHTAHFSIGSGTKLAMEDAIVLVEALGESATVQEALVEYERRRWVDVAKLQKAAKTSQTWFENIARYRDDPPLQFAVNLLSRSKRVTYGNLRVRDPGFVKRLDRWFAARAGCGDCDPAPPPMFTPFRLRGLTLPNRVVVSPMCQYSADDGIPADWHLVHLGSRAIGGAGLVITEMTDVSREGRISPGCAGLYLDEHVAGWRRIVDFVHRYSPAKIAVQLAHAGRKGSTKRMWEGADQPLDEGNWPLLSASALPYRSGGQTPKAMDRADMDQVRDDFVHATRRALAAGFDLLEVHMAHGYLLSSFISPLSNRRDDEYGGDLPNRMRFPLEVFDAVRAVWPAERPMSVRISATDWVPGGVDAAEAVRIARLLAEHGCDLVDVSAGQTTPDAQPEYGRMFQTPFADRIRREVGIATMAVGAIQGWDHINTILAAGHADLCALARPHLFDPYLTLHAAADLEWHDAPWPNQYLAAKPRPPPKATGRE